jgi:hypothetical protein
MVPSWWSGSSGVVPAWQRETLCSNPSTANNNDNDLLLLLL